MNIQAKSVRLKHHKTGVEKEFLLRLFRPGDEEEVLKCVEEEYGDTYYRREYYDRDLLLKQTGSGKLLLFLACCDGELCGIQSIISHSPGETRLEAASQIFKKAYRGYGLPYELVKYTYEAAKSLKPSCIYASTVIFHNITQKMCEDAGMKAVAFNFGSHLTSGMHNSYSLGKSEKYGQAILILPVAKQDAGNVYIHPEIENPVKRLYRELGVNANIISRTSDALPPEGTGKTLLDLSINEREQSISIKVKKIGKDLMEVIKDIKDSHSKKYWTIQLILPVDEECALSAYEKLRKEGFFFTGLRPLCSSQEEIFMQYTGDVLFCFEEFSLTDEFKLLLNEILERRKSALNPGL